MTKRVVSVLALIALMLGSFFTGYYVDDVDTSPTVQEGTIDETFLEVLNTLMENHYTRPTKELLMEGAIDGMVAVLNDPFTTYFDYEEALNYQAGFGESYVGIGITVRDSNGVIVVENVKDNGPADEAGIRVNDVIAFVNNEDIRDKPMFEVIGMVVGEEGTDVTIGVIRQGVDDPIQLRMTRSVIDNATVIHQTIDHNGKTFGYIEVTTFGNETASLFRDAINALENNNVEGIIVDLRNNGGGHLGTVYNMMNEFLVDNDKPMFTTESFYNNAFNRQEYYATNTNRKDYPIVTLVNQNSASASEVFASGMQEHGQYSIVGKSTYGKGTMQTDIRVTTTEGDSIHVTIGKWFTSNEGWVHFEGGSDGVTPDVIVESSEYELAYKVFLIEEDAILYDTVDRRVANIQLILQTMGYDVRDDGYFGMNTKNAIEDIQSNNGLTVTGNIDSETLEILNEALDGYQDDLSNDTQLQEALDTIDGQVE